MTDAAPTPRPSKNGHWYLYILLCADHSLYTGVTKDLRRRLHEHNHGHRAARYTRGRRPVRLIYFETHLSRSTVCKREYRVKQMSAEQKISLILTADRRTLMAGGAEEDALARIAQTLTTTR